MTREDIIRMAREAGLEVVHFTSTPESIEHFAELVAAAEREAIIQTVNELTDDRHPMFEQGYGYALRHIREFIEGRGKG